MLAKVTAKQEARLIIQENVIGSGYMLPNKAHCLVHLSTALIVPRHVGLMMKSKNVTEDDNPGSESAGITQAILRGLSEKHAHARKRKHC